MLHLKGKNQKILMMVAEVYELYDLAFLKVQFLISAVLYLHELCSLNPARMVYSIRFILTFNVLKVNS